MNNQQESGLSVEIDQLSKEMGRIRPIGVVVDKLTSSIENVVTGEVFSTTILRVGKSEITRVRKRDWKFDWARELNSTEREVYGLTTTENLHLLHGLISIEWRMNFVFMHLLESAKFNLGKNKIYAGVAPNLVAFACRTSFQKGGEGVVAFVSKSRLVDHYKQMLGAKQVGSNPMSLFIDTKEAAALVRRYFNDVEL